MKTLQYSFAQIEAFATIAETGSLSRAAIRLGKDRTTLRDLLDYGRCVGLPAIQACRA